MRNRSKDILIVMGAICMLGLMLGFILMATVQGVAG